MGDSYSSFERRFLDRGRWLVYTLLKPAVFLLTALHVPPDVLSVAQIGVGAAIFFTVTSYPRLTFLLFLLALLLDGLMARWPGIPAALPLSVLSWISAAITCVRSWSSWPWPTQVLSVLFLPSSTPSPIPL